MLKNEGVLKTLQACVNYKEQIDSIAAIDENPKSFCNCVKTNTQIESSVESLKQKLTSKKIESVKAEISEICGSCGINHCYQ